MAEKTITVIPGTVPSYLFNFVRRRKIVHTEMGMFVETQLANVQTAVWPFKAYICNMRKDRNGGTIPGICSSFDLVFETEDAYTFFVLKFS